MRIEIRMTGGCVTFTVCRENLRWKIWRISKTGCNFRHESKCFLFLCHVLWSLAELFFKIELTLISVVYGMVKKLLWLFLLLLYTSNELVRRTNKKFLRRYSYEYIFIMQLFLICKYFLNILFFWEKPKYLLNNVHAIWVEFNFVRWTWF